MSIFDKNGKFNPVGWSEEEIASYCEEFFGDKDFHNKQKHSKPKLSLVVNKNHFLTK